jgi:hypothetical protein
MKFLSKLVLIASVACACAFNASAGLQTSSLNGGTNNVAAVATNNYSGVVFDFSKTTDATLQVSFASTGTNVTTSTFVFDESADSVNWQTSFLTLNVAGNGTNTVVCTTNLLSGFRAPFVRLSSCGNTNSTIALTNVTVKAFSKTGI